MGDIGGMQVIVLSLILKTKCVFFFLIHLHDQLNIGEQFLPNLINIRNKIPPFRKELWLRYCVSVGR